MRLGKKMDVPKAKQKNDATHKFMRKVFHLIQVQVFPKGVKIFFSLMMELACGVRGIHYHHSLYEPC